MYKNHLFIFLTLVFLFVFSGINAQKITVSGIVTDRINHVPIELATVYISESSQGSVTNEKGFFEIKNIVNGTYQFKFSYLGYETLDTLLKIDKSIQIKISLAKTSLELKEVNVMARDKRESATTSLIKRTAIDYLQPSTLGDVLQLLPGGLLSDSKLSSANQISMRQAGSDINTALGTAVVVDGVPMSNDNNMQSFYGTSSMSDVANSKNAVNGGVDLRRVSTDHIDEIEVIRGIPSVKYGDLTSGAIIVKSKKGETPLSIRIKSDPLNKLVYVGKGFKLPNEGGILNIGVDYTNYVDDQRSPFDQYQRITSNLNYEKLINQVFLSSTQLAYTGTIDKQIYDADLMNKEDSYKSDYNGVKFKNSGTWNVNNGILKKIEYALSANYASEVMKRTKTVTLNSPMGISQSNTEGENLGIYLPSEYLTNYTVDGKPFNFYSQLTTSLQPKIGKTFNHILLGGEFRLDKNFGDGSIYDLSRPPYPTLSSSSRPRAPKDIPSLQKLTLFAEENFNADLGAGKLKIVVGIRGTTLFNISDQSTMYGKLYAEPRLNTNYQLPEIKVFKSPLRIGIKAGIGDQLKFPTAMQLYPEKSYYDISQLNYYSTSNVDNRLIYLLTTIKDRTNYDLNPARNRKIEVGFDLDYKTFSFDLTLFREKTRNSFEQQTLYFPLEYKKYDASSFTGSGKPAVSDFSYTQDTLFLSYAFTTNASVVVKEGIEYQLRIKKIKAIKTEIVINGAWFHTQYDISQPRYKYPTIVSGGKYYPYVAVFNAGSDSKYNDQFNTTIFLNTHLPKQRLLFSTSIQSVWFTSYKMIEYSGIPDAYLDLAGNTHPFTEAEKESAAFKSLIETFSTAYFKPEKTPISLEVNLKATKEIGNNLKVSFFVNRLFDYNPRYTSRFGVEIQKWVTPFMGAEILFKL